MHNFVTRNLSIKIVCVLAATVLWIYVVSAQNSIAKFPGSVKIKAFNSKPGLVAVYDIENVEIKVMTESANWKKLSADSFSAYVDLSSYDAGTFEVPINVVSSVPNVQIVEKNPEKILVSLEPLIAKSVPVMEKTEGSAAEGMTTGTISFSPDTVEIKGAKSIVDNISEVTAKIVLDGESDNFTRVVSLTLTEGYDSRSIEISPLEVEASVSVVKGADIKSVGVKVNIKGSPKDNYYISNIKVEPSVIDIVGPVTILSDVKYIETSPVDVSNSSNNISKEVSLELPEGISLFGSNPSRVRIELVFSPVEIYKEISTSNFRVVNGDRFNILSFLPSEIKIKCSGQPSSLSLLKPSDFIVNLDFKDRFPNSNNEVNLTISRDDIASPQGVSVIDVTPENITARIK